MNLRKHLAGLALFSAILGGAIFINHYLTLPDARVPPVPLNPPVVELAEGQQLINYKVRQVSLDFVNRASYTTLNLKLLPGRTAPEKIWVTTFYFSPDIDRSGWSETTEVAWPFGMSDQVELVTTEPLEMSPPLGPPGAAYFARVYVSAGRREESSPPAARFDRDITDAIPVVVQYPDRNRPRAGTAEGIVRGKYFIR